MKTEKARTKKPIPRKFTRWARNMNQDNEKPVKPLPQSSAGWTVTEDVQPMISVHQEVFNINVQFFFFLAEYY